MLRKTQRFIPISLPFNPLSWYRSQNFTDGLNGRFHAMHTITRRNFIRTTGASVVAGGILAMDDKQTHARKKPYGNLRMGIQSYSVRAFKFPEAMKIISDFDLKHMELFPGHLSHKSASAEAVKDAKSILKDLGLSCDAYGVTGFTSDEAEARAVFEFGREMGLISISADPTPDAFDVLDKLVEEYKIPIAIHNHGPKHRWGDPNVILDAIKDHHPLIGVCADTGHFMRSDVDPVEAIKILKGRVYGIHVKDFINESKEAIAGDGKLDLKALFAECIAQDFQGACSIEYELTPQKPMLGIQKGLHNIRYALANL